MKRNKMYKRMHLNVRLEKEKIPWRLVQTKAYRNKTFQIFVLITNSGKVLSSPSAHVPVSLSTLFILFSDNHTRVASWRPTVERLPVIYYISHLVLISIESCYYMQICYIYICFKFSFNLIFPV
jgi:hypothetical protein